MTDKLSEETVKNLPVPVLGNCVTYFVGHKIQGTKAPRGFGVRVTKSGARAFVLNYRIRGREFRYTIGRHPDWTVLRAVREARTLRQRVDRGENPLDDRLPAPETVSVSKVLDDFILEYALPKLRGHSAIESAFEQHVKPIIGKVGIYELDRGHIKRVVDKIEANAGPVMADRTRAYLRKAFAWHAEGDTKFNLGGVFVKAAARGKKAARDRILSDSEILALWPLLDKKPARNGGDTFRALVKTLLLTGQRRVEVSGMQRSEIDAEWLWRIPSERYKTKRAHEVPLSSAARNLVGARLESGGCDFVFASTVKTAFTAFGLHKRDLDVDLLAALRAKDKNAKLPNWRLHDLRRTARTLMARAGVRRDVSERVLGHVMDGVEGTYDRHRYLEEKRDALEKLASLIELIVHPQKGNVVQMGGR